MSSLLNRPLLVLLVSLVVLSLSVRIGIFIARKIRPPREDEKNDLELVVGATLSLLALIIGFSFSMAVTRYDQRKNYEAEEANAIGTEYVRFDLLPAADAAAARDLLSRYLDQRLLFYTTRDMEQLKRVDRDTADMQAKMWSVVTRVAAAHTTPTVALTVSGMNDVLNIQGYIQAAWWNRIPIGAWALMAALAICCNLLVGYGARCKGGVLSIVLPFVISLAFFLIADIESPRTGLIRVHPHNLVALSAALHNR